MEARATERGAATGEGWRAGPGEEGRGRGKGEEAAVSGIPGPEEASPSCSPLWLEPPTIRTWLRSVSPTAPRAHIYEARLMVQHQARLPGPCRPYLLPSPLSGRGGPGQLSAAHLPPRAAPCPLPHPHTHPLHGPFTGAEAMSAGSLRRGQRRQQGTVSWKRALSPRNILFGLLPALRSCQEPE